MLQCIKDKLSDNNIRVYYNDSKCDDGGALWEGDSCVMEGDYYSVGIESNLKILLYSRS